MRATFLALCFASALLSTVTSLRCTYCSVINTLSEKLLSNPGIKFSSEAYCDGPVFNCSSEDACGSIYVSEINYNHSKEVYFKRDCVKIHDCNMSESISTPGMKLSYSITCCNTDSCTPVQPVLKAENTTKNEALCPACYSEHGECEAKYSMQCTGEEKYCLGFKRENAFNMNEVYSSGCSTKNVSKKDRNLEFLSRPKSTETVSCNKVNSNPDQKTGHFIWCTICHDYNIDGCRDKPHLCSPHEDVCVFERKRSIYNGEDEVEIIKRCGKSSECNRAGSIRSLTKTILINTTCCDQSLCDSPLPSFPVTNNDTNGVICPACFVPNSDRCLGRSDLKCIGNEKRCIHYKRAEKQDLYIVTESLHGCTTDEVCEAGSSLLLPNGVHYKTIKTDIACNNAITHRTESYPFLLLTVTALSVLKVEM